MVREIHNRVMVSGREIFDSQFVSVREPIRHDSLEISRVTLFTILAQISEFEADDLGTGNFPRAPNHFVETLQSAMKMILAVILRQRVCGAAQTESSKPNPVRIS